MVGVPVTTTFDLSAKYFSASLNPSNILSNFFSKNLVAFPGYALLSCINVGIPSLCAAVIAPPQIYPPVPITISGLNSFTIFFASPKPFNVLKLFDNVLNEIFLLIP